MNFYGLFSPSRNELCLKCIEVGMERGCWAWNVLIMIILSGASIFGTIKCCAWFLMTHSQVLKNDNTLTVEEEDTRKVIKKSC